MHYSIWFFKINLKQIFIVYFTCLTSFFSPFWSRNGPKLRGFGRGKLLQNIGNTQTNGFGASKETTRNGFGGGGGSNGCGKSGGFGSAKTEDDGWNDDAAVTPSFGSSKPSSGFGGRGGGFGGGRGELNQGNVQVISSQTFPRVFQLYDGLFIKSRFFFLVIFLLGKNRGKVHFLEQF